MRSVGELGRLDFWQIAMKPGRPLAFGRLGDAVFVGLPGNPVATMVCFLLFARPVLLRLGGAGWRGRPPSRYGGVRAGGSGPAAASICAPPWRRTKRPAARARIEREGSGILTSMVEAQGLVELDDAVERVDPGDTVRFLSFPELGIPA